MESSIGNVLNSKMWGIPEAASIGIIGGADGPTAIFITGTSWIPIALTAAVVVTIAGLLLFKKLRK